MKKNLTMLYFEPAHLFEPLILTSELVRIQKKLKFLIQEF